MRDFHTPDPDKTPLLRISDEAAIVAAVVGCMGMLAGGIVIGAYATDAISTGAYALLLGMQLVVTHLSLWRFRKRSLQWLKMMGELQ